MLKTRQPAKGAKVSTNSAGSPRARSSSSLSHMTRAPRHTTLPREIVITGQPVTSRPS